MPACRSCRLLRTPAASPMSLPASAISLAQNSSRSQPSSMFHALSSGPPPSGVAIIRISGAGTPDLIRRLTNGARLPPPRAAMLRSIHAAQTGQLLDRSLLILFPGPNSFTGEDSAEIHCHGSPAIVSAILATLSQLGSRPAEAGEFTRRAFENGRIDLTQAEALADLIAAETDAQRDQALANAGGRLRALADGWRQRLIECMADIEAHLDFADEADVTSSAAGNLAPASRAIDQLHAEIAAALASAPVAERIRLGLAIAIIGPPNAGKSSLLNALARRDAAIVTPIPGTTRDLVEVHLNLAGRPAILIDTAGLRDTTDPVEAEGIARARTRAATADLVLNLGAPVDKANWLNIKNKIDQSADQPGIRNGTAHIAATTGAGLAELEQWLADWAEQRIPSGEPPAVTTARQAHLLEETRAFLAEAMLEPDPVLRADSLRAAAAALGRLTGHIDPEQVLGEIFGRFCIGK